MSTQLSHSVGREIIPQVTLTGGVYFAKIALFGQTTQKENNYMFSLEDLLGPQQGSDAVNQISQHVGAEPSAVNSVIQMALPALVNGLANNASTPQGAESLNNALEQHNGSILGNLGGLASAIFGGGGSAGGAATAPATDAGGILGHILGSGQGAVAQEVSNKTGVSVGQVAQILMFLAPLVMGYLGKQKQEQGLDAGGLANVLAGQQQQIQASPQGGFLSSILDRNHDGSMVDDIASMAFSYLRNR